MSALEFTGERFTPECAREIWYEHWHRYAFAATLAAGKRVLDAACGEGYGSDLLARHAAQVLGVDLSEATIAHAAARYVRPNLSFARADATDLSGLPEGGFDLIVSFETLEHVAAQEAMVAGFARLLAPGGLLLISSPDRRQYSDLRGWRNEHHVRELYRDELEALLGRHFPAVRLLGQKLLFQSAIWSLDAPPERTVAQTVMVDGSVQPGLRYEPLYFIAACAKTADALPDLARRASWFGDVVESFYNHCNAEIARVIQAQNRIVALERELEALRAPRPWWRRLLGTR